MDCIQTSATRSVDTVAVVCRHLSRAAVAEGTCLGHSSAAHSQVLVAQKVTTGVYKGVTTSELDDLAAETAASMTATHPDYATVCPRLPDPSWKQNHHHEVQSPQVSAIIYVVSRAARGKDSGVKPAQKHHEVLQRDVRRHFKLLRSCALAPCQAFRKMKGVHVLSRIKVMYSHVNSKNGQQAPLIAEDVYDIVMRVRSTCRSQCRSTPVCTVMLSPRHLGDGLLLLMPR
jgi:hypothetical protein